MRRNMDMQIGALTMSMSHTSVTEHSPGLRHLDPDTDFKVRRITSCINEAIHMAANEPSLGLYRIQEHVHRTAPQLAHKKKDLKANNKRIDETLYDLNLSMDVVDSMRGISNFTRIQEVLKAVVVTKQKLNHLEEEEKLRKEFEAKNAKIANRSLSCNEPAEGYICPVCYFALTGQEELISHWQKEHNLDECDNDTFQEVEMPVEEHSLTVEESDDTTVILSPKIQRGISEGEDVLGSNSNYLGHNVTTISEASSSIEDLSDTGCKNEISTDDVNTPSSITGQTRTENFTECGDNVIAAGQTRTENFTECGDNVIAAGQTRTENFTECGDNVIAAGQTRTENLTECGDNVIAAGQIRTENLTDCGDNNIIAALDALSPELCNIEEAQIDCEQNCDIVSDVEAILQEVIDAALLNTSGNVFATCGVATTTDPHFNDHIHDVDAGISE